MKTHRFLLIIICVMQAACQTVATPTMLPAPTPTAPTRTPLPTITSHPTATASVTITPALPSNLGYWNELQYDTGKWTVLTYNDTEWTPQTYPVYTLEPVLIHNSIENCMIYLQEGRGLPAGWTYEEIPVIIGGHVIFDERIFQSDGRDQFMVIVGSYHVDFPHNESKSECIKDAERVVMTGMGLRCPSGNCGYCPGLPPTNLKIGDMVMLVSSDMTLPVTEPDSNDPVGMVNDWYFPGEGYPVEVVDGPVCANDNAWWQLRSPNGIPGWDSDDHFLIEP